MDKKTDNDRELATERLFSFESDDKSRPEQVSDDAPAAAPSDEELFLQNIFYDKEGERDDASVEARGEQAPRGISDTEAETPAAVPPPVSDRADSQPFAESTSAQSPVDRPSPADFGGAGGSPLHLDTNAGADPVGDVPFDTDVVALNPSNPNVAPEFQAVEQPQVLFSRAARFPETEEAGGDPSAEDAAGVDREFNLNYSFVLFLFTRFRMTL